MSSKGGWTNDNEMDTAKQVRLVNSFINNVNSCTRFFETVFVVSTLYVLSSLSFIKQNVENK